MESFLWKPFKLISFRYMPRNLWAIFNEKKYEKFRIKVWKVLKKTISIVSHLRKLYSKYDAKVLLAFSLVIVIVNIYSLGEKLLNIFENNRAWDDTALFKSSNEEIANSNSKTW